MKINAILINNKKYIYQKTLIMLLIFIAGTVLGAIYCTLLSSQSDDSLNSYLFDFFSRIKDELPYVRTLKSSLIKNIRIFFIIFMCSYFRFGKPVIASVVGIKGFVSGFTSGTFIKYFGIKGMLLPLSSLFSNILFIPAFLILSAKSGIMASDRREADKITKRKYLSLAICCLTIFCASSVLDSYITTTFMKLISSLFTK